MNLQIAIINLSEMVKRRGLSEFGVKLLLQIEQVCSDLPGSLSSYVWILCWFNRPD